MRELCVVASVLILLLAGCGHDLRVEVDETRRCNVFRDGQPIGGRWSPGPVVDAPGALR